MVNYRIKNIDVEDDTWNISFSKQRAEEQKSSKTNVHERKYKIEIK